MRKQIKLLIYTISIFLFIPSCQKEYSYENSSSVPTNTLASFSLADQTGNCTNTLINGTYTAGTLLTAENTIEITVIVDSVGSYSVSTNTNNGISFSASGIFAQTGLEIIKLSGSGIPVATGDANFTIGTSGCTFSIDVADRPPGSAVFTYDGAPGNCTNISRGGTYTAGVPLTSANMIKIDVNVVITGTYSIVTPVVNGFAFTGSGNLETMGYQVVTLTGTGTPLVDGVFNFIPPNNGCPFQISVDL